MHAHFVIVAGHISYTLEPVNFNKPKFLNAATGSSTSTSG